MDYDILIALAQREAYERYARFIKRSSLSKEAHTLFEAMGEWFKHNPSKREIEWAGFAAWFTLVRHAKMSADQQTLYKGLLDMLAGRELSGALDSLMEGLTRRDYFARIGELALRGADGDYTVTIGSLRELTDQYFKDVNQLDSLERDLGSFSVETLGEALQGGLQWRMHALRQSLGPIRQGDLGVFAARPDTGKTTFLASEGSYMAGQLPDDKGVLWINNEEQGDKVRRRIMQAAIGWTVKEMEEDFHAAMAEYEQAVGHREKILVFDRAKVHTKDVETLCKRHNVGLIIFDQLRKVHGFEQEAEHERQTLLYNWARELAKEHAPVINVTQAGAEGADQKWLGMESIYGAKCLAPDTEVLMYDGSTKLAKDVELGDSVMGMDSTPRTVLSTTTGREPMYRITHKNGLSYVVNESHILTLRKTQNKGDYGNKGDVLDIPLKVYTASTNMQRHLKGFHVGVEYPQKVLPIDPYILGLWITDGKKTGPEWATTDEEFRNAIRDYAEQEGYTYKEHTDGSCWYPRLKHRQGVPHPFTLKLKELGVWRNKSIPEVYMHGSRNQRLELLAGIIDGDGNKVTRAHVYYDVYSESLALAQSVQRLAHSVGLNATVRPKKRIFRVHVSGDVADIPVRIRRKKTNYRSAHKDVTTSSLRIEPIGEGDYAGFTVDGDSRYVLGNHIVTHNTGPQGEADFVITMGRRLADGNKRYIYIPKNKLQTPGDPSQRNGRWEVEIEGDTATWKEPRPLPR